VYVLAHGKRPITTPAQNRNESAKTRCDETEQAVILQCDCLTALNCNAIHRAIHYADADYDRGKEGGRDGAMEGKQEEEKGYEDPAGSDY